MSSQFMRWGLALVAAAPNRRVDRRGVLDLDREADGERVGGQDGALDVALRRARVTECLPAEATTDQRGTGGRVDRPPGRHTGGGAQVLIEVKALDEQQAHDLIPLSASEMSASVASAGFALMISRRSPIAKEAPPKNAKGALAPALVKVIVPMGALFFWMSNTAVPVAVTPA